MNPESLSKDATRKQFARFIEGYNLATLPHPKFYNMASYEHQMNSLRNGMTADVIPSSYDPNADMTAHLSYHRRPTVEADTHLSREQLQELRQVQNERAQAGQMKFLGMHIKGTMGVRMDGTEFELVVSRIMSPRRIVREISDLRAGGGERLETPQLAKSTSCAHNEKVPAHP